MVEFLKFQKRLHASVLETTGAFCSYNITVETIIIIIIIRTARQTRLPVRCVPYCGVITIIGEVYAWCVHSRLLKGLTFWTLIKVYDHVWLGQDEPEGSDRQRGGHDGKCHKGRISSSCSRGRLKRHHPLPPRPLTRGKKKKINFSDRVFSVDTSQSQQ